MRHNEAENYAKSMFREVNLLVQLAGKIKDRGFDERYAEEIPHIEFILGHSIEWCEIVIELCLLTDGKETHKDMVRKVQRCANRMSIISRDTHNYCQKIDGFISPSLSMALASTQRASSYIRDLVRVLSYPSGNTSPTSCQIYLDCIHQSILDARQHILASDVGAVIQKYMH